MQSGIFEYMNEGQEISSFRKPRIYNYSDPTKFFLDCFSYSGRWLTLPKHMWKTTCQSITAETTVDDGGNTFEFVCGRETNHLYLPSVPVAKKGVSSSSGHNLPVNPDNAPQEMSIRVL